MLLLDAIWIGINKPMYDAMVSRVQGSPMKIRIFPAIVAYVIMYIGMVMLVIPTIKQSKDLSLKNVFKIAGVFGFSVYGIWNATNLALFSNFDYKVALLDTMWGTFLYTIVAYIVVTYFS